MPQMVIIGASGFIGTNIRKKFEQLDWRIKSVSWRNPGDFKKQTQKIAGSDVVINLSGKPIYIYWSSKNKRQILDSRLGCVNELVSVLSGLPDSEKPKLLINASGCGFYGDRQNEELTENSAASSIGFLPKVGSVWEAAATKAEQASIRVVLFRFPIVLGSNSVFWKLSARLSSVGLLNTFGKGNNWFPWVALEDVLNVTQFSINNTELSGPVNLVSPQLVTYHEFISSMRDALNNRFILLPNNIMLLLSKFGGPSIQELFLDSRKVIPAKLQQLGYQWAHPELKQALEAARSGSDAP